MPLYFAYGSNMDRAAMASRCPASRPLETARLARHGFVVTREGCASVWRDPRREVWGLLWDLALADMPALDRYENVAGRLYAKVMQPVLMQGGARRALVYVAQSAEPGPPRPGYLEAVLAAAREAGLPAPYVAEIAAWAPQTSSTRSSPVRAEPVVRPRWTTPHSRRDEPESC